MESLPAGSVREWTAAPGPRGEQEGAARGHLPEEKVQGTELSPQHWLPAAPGWKNSQEELVLPG